ncbi:hypothetical protein JL721_11427 [Aureococcus anophagefferens]|nr:hypothetical protein JL721_11427 [Aureococcus anophagefferens]
MTAACPDGAVLKLAPLKGRARAEAKARNEYAKNTAPATSWLFDVVRGSVMCATEDEIVRLYEALDEDPRVDIVRTKNRFNPPCFNGYRDILMNVAIHHAAIKQSEPMHKSHVTYEFFRYFLGAGAVAAPQLRALPVADAENVDDLVDRVLGSDRATDERLLGELEVLLYSIAEHASAVRVLEKILKIKEREFGPDHREVVFALKHLGGTYGSLGDYAKQRDLLERALAIQERTLAIQEREYGRDHERKYGGDHVYVARTLRNLGNAHGSLGDNAKARGLSELALAIFELEHGSEHSEVAITLTNLGAHIALGDAAKARDVLSARDPRREFGEAT